MRYNIITFILLLALSGCAGLQESYINSDIKTYKAVTPDLVKQYSKIDNNIERNIKLNTVKTWGDRIEEALKHDDLTKLRKSFKRTKIVK